MSLTEFLSDCTPEELTDRLLLLDRSIMDLHQNGYFVVGNLLDIEVIDNNIVLESFKNKVDYLNSGYNINGDKKDILEVCAIGVCAYHNFNTFYTNREFLNHLIENIDVFLEKNKDVSERKIPFQIGQYYESVFGEGNIEYMNNYFVKNSSSDRASNKARVYTKSTAVGRAMADKESAYVNVLLIPSVLVLIYLVLLILYFWFV